MLIYPFMYLESCYSRASYVENAHNCVLSVVHCGPSLQYCSDDTSRIQKKRKTTSAIDSFNSSVALTIQPLRLTTKDRLDSNQCSCFRRVLPTRVSALGYLRMRQTSTLSQHPFVKAELSSHTPRKISEFNSCFNFKLSECVGVFG